MFEDNDIFTTTGVAHKTERLNFRYQLLFEPVKNEFQGATVLDLGSHTGRWSYVSLKLGAAYVIGVEHSKKWHGLAEQILPAKGFTNFEFHNIEAENFLSCLGSKSPDIVLCMGLLYYLPSPQRLMTEIAKLRPKLCIVDTFQRWGNVGREAEFEAMLKSLFETQKIGQYDHGARLSYHCRPLPYEPKWFL
jgi:SAM-dependent methyltransferase